MQWMLRGPGDVGRDREVFGLYHYAWGL